MPRLCVALMLVAFVCASVVGGFGFFVKDAFAANGCNAGSCKNCLDVCKADVDLDGKVTVADVSAVYNCWKKPSCSNNPGRYDLNADGKCNTMDYQYVRKCTGCCSSPSPTK
jgi:hypothetical protein